MRGMWAECNVIRHLVLAASSCQVCHSRQLILVLKLSRDLAGTEAIRRQSKEYYPVLSRSKTCSKFSQEKCKISNY